MAFDPSPLRDFCASPTKTLLVCKDPKIVNADDLFMAAKLNRPTDTTTSKVGSNVTLINAMKIPDLNTLDISIVRIDYAPLGENPPHAHPRSTEILTVLEGALYIAFVTSNPENKLFTKKLEKGDVFVFPERLAHFQFIPCANKPAVAITALRSQNPGTITISNAGFG